MTEKLPFLSEKKKAKLDDGMSLSFDLLVFFWFDLLKCCVGYDWLILVAAGGGAALQRWLMISLRLVSDE